MLNTSVIPSDHDAAVLAETPARASCSIDHPSTQPRVDASIADNGSKSPVIGALRPLEPRRRRLHLLQIGEPANWAGSTRFANVDRSDLIPFKSRRVADKRGAHLTALRYAFLTTTRKAT